MSTLSTRDKIDFMYPPDEEICLKHKLATRIWKGIHGHEETEHTSTCTCCGRKVGEEHVPFSCCYSSYQLSFLGVGVPLFFSYLKNAILLLVTISLIFCIFGLYTNVTSTNCIDNPSCPENIFNTLSTLNKINEQSYLSIQNYIVLAFVICCLVLFQYFRWKFRKVEEECDECLNSPSDYSMILRRLPDMTTEKDILDMVEERRGFLSDEERRVTNDLKVVNVVMSFDMTYHLRKRQKYLDEFKAQIKEGDHSKYQYPELPEFNTPAYIAIVIFERQESKELFLMKPSGLQMLIHFLFTPCAPLSDFQVAGERVNIQRAPEPDDIIWENADMTVGSAICRRMILGTVSFILLCAGGALQYLLAVLQTKEEDETLKTYLGTASSVIVALTNAILQLFLVKTTFYERMNTMTEYMDVLSTKLALLQFLNSGIFIVGANILADYKTFNLENHFAENITQIMILNSITPIVATFISYKFDVSGRIFRYFYLKKECCITTQLEANELHQLPDPELPYKYGYIIKTIWLTAFYAPLVPVVVPVGVIGLFVYYWVEKCLFGGSYKAPNMISSIVNWDCMELFQYVPIILCVGQLLIFLYFKHFEFQKVPIEWTVPIFISLALSILNLLLPMQAINEKLFSTSFDLSEEPDYQDVEKQFEVTYEITNPAIQTERGRKHDVHIWKQVFGHVPSDQIQMGLIQGLGLGNANNNSMPSTDRSYNSPLLLNEMSSPSSNQPGNNVTNLGYGNQNKGGYF